MKTLLVLAAGLLAGCALQDTSEYRPGRTGVMGPDGHTVIWDPPAPAQYAGPSGEQVGEGIAQGIGNFARGYAQAHQDYVNTHPYVAPTFYQPIQPQQHGTMTVTPSAFSA
jgi:hypothetical protein